jgi:peptidoglycan hydrolase-like protein with peptidoglycan-binding domain
MALEADGDTIDDGSSASEFTERVEEAVRRYQGRHGLEVDGLVGAMTWFTMYPEFQAPLGQLAQFDVDASGRIEPDEVRAMGDSNAVCDTPADPECPSGAP